MEEMPDFFMRTGKDDKVQIAGLKTHKLAYVGSRVLFGSFVGAANAAKVLRGAIRHGAEIMFDGKRGLSFPNLKSEEDTFLFRQTGLGKGYVHCTIEPKQLEAFMVYDDSDEEWHRELLRVSTVPVLREWVPWLRDWIKADAHRLVDITTYNCDVAVYHVDDAAVSALIKRGGEQGGIELPDCETDMSEFSSLPDYIRAYAQRMVESAGSAMRPLLDPKIEAVSLPPLTRTPFVPQAWMIAAASRAMA